MRARALTALLAVVLLLLGGASGAWAQPAPVRTTKAAAPVLYLYWGEGCPKCAAEKKFLAEFQEDHPGLVVEQHEVYKDEAGRTRFEDHAKRLGIEASAVPTTVLDQRVWIGFTDSIKGDLRATLQAALDGKPVPKGVYGKAGEGTCSSTVCPVTEPEAAIDIPLLGEVNLGDKSLIVSTIAIGFVDGINPCSLWVISILLAIVIRTGSRRRVLAIGSTFLVVTAGMYALFMAGIYGALTVIGYIGAIQVAIGIAAGVFGIVSIKDYFFYKRGLSFTISDASKPGIYSRMRAVAGQKALVPALAATTALAVGVSLLETPCTAGFPVLWTGMLEARGVSLGESALLFLLYMIPFLIDEFAVFLAAVVTMRASKLQEKHGRVLKLVAGTTMLALAGTMVLAPDVMESVLGATLVFVGAGAVALIVHTATSLWRGNPSEPEPVRSAPQGADVGA